MSLPDFAALRVGNPDCPSDLALDRLQARELDANAARTLETHIAGCKSCEARMVERRAGFNAIPEVDPRRMLAQIRSRVATAEEISLLDRAMAWARRLFLPVVAVAALGAVLVFNHRSSEDPNQMGPLTRTKGSAALHVYRLVGDHAEGAISGDKFAPGDRLRFSVDLPGDGAVEVIGVEASGSLYTAWPNGGGTSTQFKAGAGIELPGAVALDNAKGRESLYLVFCPGQSEPPRCTSNGAGAHPACPNDCALAPFVLEKGP